MSEIPDWLSKFVLRWQRRLFPNDNILTRHVEDGWEVVITRGKWEAILLLDPSIYGNPRYDNKILLRADDCMRDCLRSIKEKISTSQA